jgi:hypothetical protein
VQRLLQPEHVFNRGLVFNCHGMSLAIGRTPT